jgi:uncharacterized protein YecE (DUF72 family)
MIEDPISPGRFRFGTSSWSAKSWLGSFYPTGTAQKDFLPCYSQVFNTVEADVTYYRIPSPSMVDGWKRRTPEHFTLSAKMPRAIVHAGEGPNPDPDRILIYDHVQRITDEFLGVMGRLGKRLGPLVLQFPYFNKRTFAEPGPFMERLDAYLSRLPLDQRFAVEIRNKSWVNAEFLDLLRKHQVAFVWLDLAYMPHPQDIELDLVTADFSYTRLIGDRKAIDAMTDSFDKTVIDQGPGLQRWADFLNRVARDVPESFVYANNHYAGHGPATTAELAALLDNQPPPPAPRVPRSGEFPF